jgi:hypothetical protein
MIKGDVDSGGSRSLGMEIVNMKKEQVLRLTVCAAATFLFAVEPLGAQTRRLGPQTPSPAGGAKSDQEVSVKITRFPAPNKTAMVRTPEFNYSVSNTQPKVSRKNREWALFEIKYETGAKWTDELKFEYSVITKGKSDDGKDAYSFYTASVRYVDIPKGEHMSCMAIPPSLVERYGEPVALALEVTSKDGTVLAKESKSGIPFPSEEWWRDSKVLDNPSMTRRNGLVDRSKTPFALINPDDYEVVQ